jgi:hypothetical protein
MCYAFPLSETPLVMVTTATAVMAMAATTVATAATSTTTMATLLTDTSGELRRKTYSTLHTTDTEVKLF